MRLFTPDSGYALDESSPSYRDDVDEIGSLTGKRLIEFLDEKEAPLRGLSACLKVLRTLYKSGCLKDAIIRFGQLVDQGKIVDPAPPHTRQLELA